MSIILDFEELLLKGSVSNWTFPRTVSFAESSMVIFFCVFSDFFLCVEVSDFERASPVADKFWHNFPELPQLYDACFSRTIFSIFFAEDEPPAAY